MRKSNYIAIILCLLSAILLCACNKPSIQSVPDNFFVKFLNTGKSDCAIIKIDDKIIIMDTADNDDFNYISQTLEDMQITRIDYMILSHFDNDHVGSANEIINHYDVGQIIVPNYIDNTKEYRAIQMAANAKNVPYNILADDATIKTDNGKIWINVAAQSEYEDENDFSLIVSLYYTVGDKQTSCLFLGDAGKIRVGEFNTKLAELGDGFLHYDTIKTPHHGDYSKSLKTLVSVSDTTYFIVCTDTAEMVKSSLLELSDLFKIQTYMTYDGAVTVLFNNGVLSTTVDK